MNRIVSVLILMLICIEVSGCAYLNKDEYSLDFNYDKSEYAQVSHNDSKQISLDENVGEAGDIIVSNEIMYELPVDYDEDSYEDYPEESVEDLPEDDLNDGASLEDKYLEEFAGLAPTTRMSFEELVGDNGIYDLPIGFPVPETYYIIVDKHYQVVMVYKRDDNGEYTVPVRYMLCTTGASSSPTPNGTYQMKDYRVRYALFNNTAVYGQYWSLITGRIYFHSILYSDRDASTYTSSYNNLGKHVSHGCVRLTVPDARWIWYNCAPGTTVTIREGSSRDSETALIREQLIIAEMPEKRPEVMTGDIPWTDNWKIEDVPHDVEFIQGHQ